jgi:hypothetical protein
MFNSRDRDFSTLKHKTRLQIYVNNEDNISASGVLDIAISDHNPVFVCRKLHFGLKIRNETHLVIKYRNWNNIDNEVLHSQLMSIEINSNNQDLNKTYNDFNTQLAFIINRFFPIKQKRVKFKTKEKWLTNDIMDLMKQKDYVKRSLNLNEGIFNFNDYSHLRNSVNYKREKKTLFLPTNH